MVFVCYIHSYGEHGSAKMHIQASKKPFINNFIHIQLILLFFCCCRNRCTQFSTLHMIVRLFDNAQQNDTKRTQKKKQRIKKEKKRGRDGEERKQKLFQLNDKSTLNLHTMVIIMMLMPISTKMLL